MKDVRLLYRIVSHADLPARMQGIFHFDEAHRLCCEWNQAHDVIMAAWPERINEMR